MQTSFTPSHRIFLFCFWCQTCLISGALSLVGFRRKFGDSCFWNPCLNDFPRTASRWNMIFPHRHFRACQRHGIFFLTHKIKRHRICFFSNNNKKDPFSLSHVPLCVQSYISRRWISQETVIWNNKVVQTINLMRVKAHEGLKASSRCSPASTGGTTVWQWHCSSRERYGLKSCNWITRLPYNLGCWMWYKRIIKWGQ